MSIQYEGIRNGRRIVAQLSKRGSREEKEFDRRFWRELGHEARMDAAWDMTYEVYYIRGQEVGESRLQRDVEHLERRGR